MCYDWCIDMCGRGRGANRRVVGDVAIRSFCNNAYIGGRSTVVVVCARDAVALGRAPEIGGLHDDSTRRHCTSGRSDAQGSCHRPARLNPRNGHESVSTTLELRYSRVQCCRAPFSDSLLNGSCPGTAQPSGWGMRDAAREYIA